MVVTSEVGIFFSTFHGILPEAYAKMQPGGTRDFGFVKVTMTASSNKSCCTGPEGVQIPGGLACGFVFTIPNHDIRIYHAGQTAMFSDMKIIDDLYQPDIILLPVGVRNTMNIKEAAYALMNFFPTPKTVVPMWMNDVEDQKLSSFDFRLF